MDRGIIKAIGRAAQRQPVVVAEAPAGLDYQFVVTALITAGTYRHVVDIADYAGVGARELVALLNTCEHGTIVTNTHANPAVYVAVEHVMRLNRPGHFLLIGEFIQSNALLQSRIRPLVVHPPTMAELYGGPASFLTGIMAADPDTSQHYPALDLAVWPRQRFVPAAATLPPAQAEVLPRVPATGCYETSLACEPAVVNALCRSRVVHVVEGWKGSSRWVLPAGWLGDSSRDGLRALVAAELLTQAATDPAEHEFRCFEDPRGEDIDLIVSPAAGEAGVWVQVSDAVDPSKLDSSVLASCQRRCPGVFLRGVVFYAGSDCVALEPGVFAVPITALWTATSSEITTAAASLEDELTSVSALLRQQLPDLTRNSVERTQRLIRWMEDNAQRPFGRVVTSMTNLGLPCEVSVSGAEGRSAEARFTVRVGSQEICGSVQAEVDEQMTVWRSALGAKDSSDAADFQVKARLAWSDTFSGGYESVLERVVADLVARLPGAISTMLSAA